MTELEVRERFVQWLQGQGSQADISGFNFAQLRDDVWILTPSGRGNAVFIVTPALVRGMHPSEGSLAAVLAELGIEVQDL